MQGAAPARFRSATFAASIAAVIAGPAWPAVAGATPSGNFWAPSTPAVQPFGVVRITYDSYFQSKSAYPTTLGLTIGALPWQRLQAEVGFDLLYPTIGPDDSLDVPILLNGKIGVPEHAFSAWQPGGSFGI